MATPVRRPRGRIGAALLAVAMLLPALFTVPAAADDHADEHGSYTVTVRDDISSAPVEGADVHIESEVDGQPYDEGTVATDADGRAEFDGISLDGGLEVTVTAAGFQTATTSIPAASAVDDGGLSVRIVPEGDHLHGGVYDADTSDTIAGATLTLDGAGTATSDANGDYEFRYVDPAGELTLTVDADGYETYEQTIDVDGATLYPVNLEPVEDPEPDTVMAIGTVEDGQGNPVAGATVQLALAGLSTDSDSGGVFMFDAAPVGSDTLVVSAKDYESSSQAVTVTDAPAGHDFGPVTLDPEPSVDPTNFEVEPGDGELHASWDAPTAGFDHYELRWRNIADTNWSMVELDDDVTSHTIDGLDNDVPYFVEIRTREGSASGEWISAGDGVVPTEGDDEPGRFEGGVFDADDDSPIEGASVQVDGAYVTTDEDGLFSIDVDAGIHDIDVSIHGWENTTEHDVEIDAGESLTVDFELHRERATLDVEVRDDNGDLLDNASASLNTGPFIGPGDGTFSTTLEPGTYELEVSADGFESESRTFEADWGDVIMQVFALEPEPSGPTTIEGTITDADTGDPIDGATVTFSGGSSAVLTTGEDGTYTNIGVDAAPTTVTAEADGYVEASETVDVAENETVTVDLGLEAETGDPAELSISVLDYDANEPLAGATVLLNGDELTEDGDGEFAADNLDAGTYTIEVEADGFQPQDRTVDLDWGDVRAESFGMQAAQEPATGEIAGTVTDASTGDPIEGADVALNGDTTTTGADGTYGFGEIQPGEYTLTVNVDGYESDDLDVEIVDGDTIEADFALEAEPQTGSVEGTVTDTDGDPVAGATVTVDGHSAETYADGSYVLTGVDAGSHTVGVVASGFEDGQQDVDLDAGETATVNFELTAETDPDPEPETATLSGTVSDSEGNPIEGAELTLDGQTATSGPDGTFVFEDVAAGSNLLGVAADGFESDYEEMVLEAGQEGEVHFVLVSTIDLDGVEVNCATHDGAVAPGETVACTVTGLEEGLEVSVTAVLNPTLVDTTVTGDAEGNATFDVDVPEDAADGDRIVVTVAYDGDEEASTTFVVEAPEDTEETTEGTTVVVSEENDTEELPRTGASVLLLALFSLLTMAFGGALLRTSRQS